MRNTKILKSHDKKIAGGGERSEQTHPVRGVWGAQSPPAKTTNMDEAKKWFKEYLEQLETKNSSRKYPSQNDDLKILSEVVATVNERN